MSTSDTYKVSLSKRSQRETHKLDRQVLARVARAFDGLADNPRPVGYLKVKHQKGCSGSASETGEQIWNR